MKEGVLYIELMNGPVLGESQRQDSANCDGLDNRAECLIIINTRSLCEPPKNPSILVPIQWAICMKLVTIDPFPGHQVCTSRTWN